MTNAALQAMINEFGEAISIIIFDNNSKIYNAYPSSPLKSIHDIELRTISGEDMIGVPFITGKENIPVTMWHPTSNIQVVGVMNEGYERYRIDPFDIG